MDLETVITSPSNPKFKKLLSLTQSRGVVRQKLCLVSGKKLVSELWRSGSLARGDFWIAHPKCKWLGSVGFESSVLFSKSLFNQLDVCGTGQPLLCTSIPSFYSYERLDLGVGAVFSALGDPSNLGALIRSSVAFGMGQMVLLKESAHPFLPKAIRASSGSCFQIKFFSGPSIKDLKDPQMLALDLNGVGVKEVLPRPNARILVGQEGGGVPPCFPGVRVHFPMSGPVESLNGPVAASLFLYEWHKTGS